MTKLNSDVTALVPAAGSGTRLGLGLKANLILCGRTLVEWVSDKLQDCVGRVLVGVRADDVASTQARLGSKVEVVAGGSTRQETIQKLLTRSDGNYVVILDATRPFASKKLICQVIDAARQMGASGAFVEAQVPLAFSKAGVITQTLPRTGLLIPQAPHAYRRETLMRAYEVAAKEGLEYQSSFELVAKAGFQVLSVPGEGTNIKITTEQDWATAQWLATEMKTSGHCYGGNSHE